MGQPRARRFRLLLAALLVPGFVGLAGAQGAAPPATPPGGVTLPQPLTHEAIRELVARLSDAEVRALLLSQLDRAAAPSAGAAGGMAPMLRAVDAETSWLRERVGQVAAAAGTLPEAVSAAMGRLVEGRGPYHPWLVAVFFAAMLAAGWGVERGFRRAAASARRDPVGRGEESLGTLAGRLLLRLIFDLLALAAFLAGALATFFAVYQGHEPTRELVWAYLGATVAVRLTVIVSRFLLAPRTPAERLLPFDDAAAGRLQVAIVRLAVVVAFGTATLTLWEAWGVPEDALVAPRWLLGTFVAGLFVHLLWQNRTDVATLIRGKGSVGELACEDCGRRVSNPARVAERELAEDPCPACGSGTLRALPGRPAGRFRLLLADLWPLLATVYVALVLLAWTVELVSGRPVGAAMGIGSLVVVALLPVADMALCRVLAAVTRARGVGAPADTRPSFEPVLREGIHIVVTVAGLLVIARLWGLDLFALAEQGVGRSVTRAIIDVAVTGLLAYLAWQLVKTAIDRRFATEPASVGTAKPGEIGGTGASRIQTLLPPLRLALLVTIGAMAVMVGLSALGVNVVPLLAGAGVVGIAIGFGAQTLVRDVVAGVFFLVDDAFRLGEYIDVGDVKGTVEKVSFRSMQLRHHRGSLNTVSYGTVRRLINHSRDWVIEKIEFRLTYDTDLVRVKKILKRIGEELSEDPEIGPMLLQPLKSQGVLATEDSALLVRAKFMAKPGGQFSIRREAYQRVLKAFKEAGIKFAHRQVTVFVPPGTGTAAAAAAGGAAGAAASEERAGEGAPPG